MPARTHAKILKGIIASPGIAIGKAYVLNRFHLCVIRHAVNPENIKAEVDRFYAAIETTKSKMVETARQSVKNLSDNMSYILHPQIQLLNDPSIINATKKAIESDKVNAEWALQKTHEKIAARFKKIKDPYFKERLHDFDMVINKVLQVLTGTEHETLDSVTEPVIVVAHDISPFDTAQMATKNILGFVTEVGGKTSHTGIIASSLQIPALAGVQRITHLVKTGDIMVLDSIGGHLILNPSEDEFARFNKRRLEDIYFDKQLEGEVDLAAETKDGVKISLKGNIESSKDIKAAIDHGADGIGLYRTEFQYIGGRGFPSEEKQFEEYKMVAESVAPSDAVIRTLDLGGDKLPMAYEDEAEPNPSLGLRAIRFCLDNRQLFNAQLKAILRASHYGNIRIMFPMVSCVEEIRKAHSIFERMKKELRGKNIPFDEEIKVGMMVEVPSVAFMIDEFSQYVDFFSIGTNDLIQYQLATDRGNEKVAHLYEPLHPSVLRLLHMIITSANRNKVPISICGQMSADPVYAYILIGMGEISALSMEGHSLLKIKRVIRSINAADARKDVDHILSLGMIRNVHKYLLKEVVPKLGTGLASEIESEEYGRGLFR